MLDFGDLWEYGWLRHFNQYQGSSCGPVNSTCSSWSNGCGSEFHQSHWWCQGGHLTIIAPLLQREPSPKASSAKKANLIFLTGYGNFTQTWVFSILSSIKQNRWPPSCEQNNFKFHYVIDNNNQQQRNPNHWNHQLAISVELGRGSLCSHLINFLFHSEISYY